MIPSYVPPCEGASDNKHSDRKASNNKAPLTSAPDETPGLSWVPLSTSTRTEKQATTRHFSQVLLLLQMQQLATE
eukprot:1150862-Pelagomonas_calceolata.AAC.5